MSGVWIVEAAALTPLGDLDASWRRLLTGDSAIRPAVRFAAERYVSCQAACIGALDEEEGNGVSRIHRLLAMLLDDFAPVPTDAVPLTATTKGGIDSLERRRRGLWAPEADLLAGEMPRLVGRRFGLVAAGFNVNAACASSTIALARGGAMIAAGATEAVLVVCADLVSEFVFSGFSALKGLSPEPCRPFDRRRDGLTLGEGGAALLLMAAERARREGRTPLATLSGWGVAADAFHVTAPARDGGGLIQAVQAALRRAGRQPAEVAAISAHGTGTVYNDAMELTAFAALFEGRPLPLHSVKGAIGHTLGAAGGIEAALALRSLAHGVIPPTVGCGDPETAAVSDRPLPFAGELLLSTNSGFGGINAALLLEKGEGRNAR